MDAARLDRISLRVATENKKRITLDRSDARWLLRFAVQALAQSLAPGSGTKCVHPRTRNLYSQLPPSEGRRLVAVRRLCEDCGAVLKIAQKPQETEANMDD